MTDRRNNPDQEVDVQPTCCRDVGTTMVGHFVTRLEVEAGKAGGSLTAPQIRALARRFVESEQDRFTAYFRRAWEACGHERETLQWDGARDKPFERILMGRFAHLFPARGGDDGGEDRLSRRMIPGFHLAVDKMIGPTLFEQCRVRAGAILERHARPGGGHDWRAVQSDAEARLLVDDVVMVIAHRFAEFERRRTWFIDLVNARLAPARRGARDEHWRLTDSAFADLMRALLAETASRVSRDPASAESRWGIIAPDALNHMVRRLGGL